MVRRFGRWWLGGLFLLAAVAQLLLAVSGGNERIGDRIQVALPLAGAACALASRDFGSFGARFAGAMAIVHGLKNGLGGAALNQRPTGGARGFPSGHTAAAAFGASYLVHTCAAAVPGIGPVLVLAAGFVAGSRIEAGRHSLLQVVAGAVIGVGFDRGLRNAAQRRRWGRWLGQLSVAATQAARLAVSRTARAGALSPVVPTHSAGAAAVRAGKSMSGVRSIFGRGRPARM